MTGRTPAVSVIMGVYNQWDREALRRAVQSILDQTFRDFEFIICDDGSDPEAAVHIRELQGLDERIILIGKEENRGLAFSLNACISLAKGRYIARMDADDISLPERLQTQYDFMENHPEYAWCGCNTKLFDAEGIWGHRRMPERPEPKDYLKYSPYVHPTVLYRREIFAESGGYLEAEEMLRCEDYEIFMRLRQQGLRGYNIQQELFCYREDKEAFHRRKMKYRVNEARLRWRNFRKMKLLLPFGWLYVIRPVLGGLLPAGAVAWLKRREAAESRREPDRFEMYKSILAKAPSYAEAVEQTEAEQNLLTDVRLYLHVMAPVLTEFVGWVLEQAAAAGKRRLYFLSRDGYQMYVIARRLTELGNLPVECRYLHVSRCSLRVPEYHLDLGKALDRICVGGIDVTPEKILRRAALTEEEAAELAAQLGWQDNYREILDYRQIQERKRALRRHGGIFPLMERHSRAEYENAIGYLRQEGLYDPVSYAIVDSGWTGTLQETLQNLLRNGRQDISVDISADADPKVSLEGYYFGLYELPAGADPATYHAYYFSPGKGLRRKIRFSNSLFEAVCSADEGMTAGYVRDGGRYMPRLSTAHNANQMQLRRNLEALERFLAEYGKVEEHRDSAERRKSEEYGKSKGEDLYSRKVQRTGKQPGRESAGLALTERLMTPFMAHPTEAEAAAYGDALFSDDILERELKKVAAELTEREIRNQGLIRRLCIVAGLKNARIRESAWIEGSIVRCGRHVKRNLRTIRRYKFLVYVRKTLKTGKKKKYAHEQNEGRTPTVPFCRPADGGAGGEKKIRPILPGNRVECAEPIVVNGGHVADLFHHL